MPNGKLYHHVQCESCGRCFCVAGEGKRSQPEPYCPDCTFEHSFWSATAFSDLLPNGQFDEGRAA